MTILRLRQRATRETPREKTLYPLAVLAAEWRRRASDVLHVRDPTELVARVTAAARRQYVLRVDDFAGERAEALVNEVLARLHESRSTWSHWNILAETARATMKYRMASTADRDALHQRLVAEVESRSVLLTAPPPALTPAAFRRPDGGTQFQP